MFLHDICCSEMCRVVTRYSANVATCFILSQHISQNSNVLIKTQNFTLEDFSFQLSIQKVLFSDLTQEACRVAWYFTGIVLQVKLLVFPSLW